MGEAIITFIVLFIFWFVVNGKGDMKKEQQRAKLIRASRKLYKENKANG